MDTNNATINVTINGKTVAAQAGKTILDIVRENNLDVIPTLCHDPRIEPFGSCFLCVVEVAGIARLIPSCCTPVTNGMVISTNNERIRASRKTALELLLSNHYADCIGPCTNNCPAHVDAQSYLALIAQGKHEEALRLIKQQNPLPLSIGRVCVRDCETACRRQIIDEPLGINHLKRYVADLDAPHKWKPELKPANGKKVAVVGAGPSGLTCAYYLTLEGCRVTVFEKTSRPGGMLMWGIPEYRLPKAILEEEVRWIADLGVDIQYKKEMGKDFTLDSLLKEGYHAVYLAVGAQKASVMRLEHENNTKGVMGGVDFLGRLPEKIPQLHGTVIVVGGGNTAIDAARNALRCGAEKVKIVYRRSLNEMPAHKEEIDAAVEEGVEILFLTLPKTILRDQDGQLKGITCLLMELVDAGPGQRPKPAPREGSDFDIPCDFLIGAIGQQVDTAFAKGDQNLKLESWGTIKVDPGTLQTSVPGVFAGGDAVTGPDTAINSIAQGKRAALGINFFLQTGRVEKTPKPFYSFKHTFSAVTAHELEHFKKEPRNKMPHLPATERAKDFREVETGYTEKQAACEPARCIECGCSEYEHCDLRKHADDYNVDITPYLGETRKYKTDARHPFIVMDPNKCINCGRCVRTCQQILEVSALGFVNRGFRAVVKPAMEKALAETNCVACGNCVDTCPTGALTEKFPFKVLGSLPKKDCETVCNFCSIGCRLNLKVMDNGLFYVSNSTEAIINSPNQGYLCIKGRFGHRYLIDSLRLARPMIKEGERFTEASWEDAISRMEKGFKDIIRRYGPDSVAVMVSPLLSNEELYFLQKFVRVGLKNNNIGSFSTLSQNAEGAVSTASMKDLRDADIVVVINGELSDENLVMELNIKRARHYRGTKLILVNSSEIALARAADLWIDTRKGSNTTLVNGLIREWMVKSASGSGLQGFEELKRRVEGETPENVAMTAGIDIDKYRLMLDWVTEPGKRVIFVYNADSTREKAPGDLQAIRNFLMLSERYSGKGGGLLLMRRYANSAGMLEMGAHPAYLPGLAAMSDTDAVKRIAGIWNSPVDAVFKRTDLESRMLKGDIKGLWVIGEDPLAVDDSYRYFKKLEFLAVMDLTRTSTADAAQVALPAASFLEQEGTFTTFDRSFQTAPKILESPAGRENWQVFSALAELFNPDLGYRSLSDIQAEINQVNRLVEPGFLNTLLNPMSLEIQTPDNTTPEQLKPPVLYSENYFVNRIKNRL